MIQIQTNQTLFDERLAELEQLCLRAVRSPHLPSLKRVLAQMKICTALVESQLLTIHKQMCDEVKRDKPDLLDNVEATQADDARNLGQWRKQEAELVDAIAEGEDAHQTRAMRNIRGILRLIDRLRSQEETLASCQFSIQADCDFHEYDDE